MFSYRHAFHAGNHADALKHATLLGLLRHLQAKEPGLILVDTHAGAGLYRLDAEAFTAGEAASGIAPIWRADPKNLPPLLAHYREALAQLNPKKRQGEALHTYPGSPWLMAQALRPQDKLRLFELHPADLPALISHMRQSAAPDAVQVLGESGFEGFKRFIPPPTKRALVLMDPSYEDKRDYARVVASCGEILRRMPTAVVCVWYPQLPRLEARALPEGLTRLAKQHNAAGKGAKVGWLHLGLRIGADGPAEQMNAQRGEGAPGMKLKASGLFLFNPPFGLKAELAAALPRLVALLGVDAKAAHLLEGGGR